MSEVIKTVALPVFVKKKHELADLLKSLEKATPAAVELIVETMNNTQTEPKLKVACATALIDMQLKVSAEISRDGLTRQIAEIKAKGLSTPLELEQGGKKPLPPRHDFTTIQEVA